MIVWDNCASWSGALNDRFAAVLSNHRCFVLLHAVGYAALLLIYTWHSLPWLLQGTYPPDLGASKDSRPVAEILQALTFIYLFALYLLSLLNWKRLKLNLRHLIWAGLAAGSIAWIVLPGNSADVFAYISFGRIAGLYAASPYLHVYSEFDDFYSPYAWFDGPMPYGPVVLPVFILAGVVSQLSLIASIYTLKLIWLLLHGCSSWLMYRILKPLRPDPAYGLFLFALNPLMLLELVINAHNDGLMILFGLLAILSLQRRQHSLALWMALLSALVKLPGALLLMGVLAFLIRQRQWRGLIYGLLGGLAAMIVLEIELLPGVEPLLNPISSYWLGSENSLHGLLVILAQILGIGLGLDVSYESVFLADRQIFAVLFLLFCLWQLWRIGDLCSLAREMGHILLGLLIGYAIWFFPWYVTWLIPFAAMAESDRLQWIIITFSATALALYCFPYFVVEQAPLSWLWGTLQLVIVHGIPLWLMIRYWIAERASWG